jgi:hypothetical protein
MLRARRNFQNAFEHEFISGNVASEAERLHLVPLPFKANRIAS